MAKKENRYTQLIEAIFQSHYKPGLEEFVFRREELSEHAERLGIVLPKNLGDVIYSLRYRIALPNSIRGLAPNGMEWIIRPAGRAVYRFVLVPEWNLVPNALLSQIKIPDGTPGVIEKYALSDEQALLAKLRYNRLIDVFTSLTCYSLQNHLRTSIADVGQVETDEIYIGVDRQGAHYFVPVQAKGGTDKLSVVQIEQDVALAAEKFPDLICRPVAAQFMDAGVIALFEFEITDRGVSVRTERHYRLVAPDELTADDLRLYRQSGSLFGSRE